MSSARAFCLFMAVVLLSTLTFGQATTGTPPFGSFGGGPLDVINLANLNVHFLVPIINKAGRRTSFNYNLAYDSSIWSPVTSGGVTSWQPATNWGWMVQSEVLSGNMTQVTYAQQCVGYTNNNAHKITNFTDPSGTSHPALLLEDPCDTGATFTGHTLDGSGWTLSYNGGVFTITSRSGKQVAPAINGVGGGGYTDTNGNSISANGLVYTDTLGTTALSITGTNPVNYNYTAPGGGTKYYQANYTTYNIRTAFGCSGINDVTIMNVLLVTSITLPDGTSYSFGYENTPGNSGYTTGRLQSVFLPSGGQIWYAYTGGNNGIECSDGSAAGLTRTTSDSPSSPWTYVRSGASPAVTTVTDPLGQKTVINFSGIYELQRQIYDANNNPLLTTFNCYNNNFSGCPTATVSAPITKKDAYVQLNNGTTNVVETQYDSTYGRLTEEKDFDWQQILVRDTVYTYATDIGGIYDRPSQITVKNGSGTVVAQTSYGYDETTPSASGVTTQHTNPTCPTGFTKCRGNLTTATYTTHGSSTISRTFTYYDTGVVKTATDVNGGVTTYSYATGITSCNGAFPTGVTLPVTSLTRSMQYDSSCYGGVLTQLTDENTNIAKNTYGDANFWRPTSVQDLSGYTTTITYMPQSGSTPASVESSLNFNGTVSTVDNLTSFDYYGRPQFQQRKQAPGNPGTGEYDTVEYIYDGLGRPYQTTLPYQGTAHAAKGPSTPVTTVTLDALGRATKVVDGGGGEVDATITNNVVVQSVVSPGTNKQRQYIYDGLGRLSSACELTAGSTSYPGGNCSASTSTIGYATNYTYDVLNDLTGVSQNAQSSTNNETRSYQYDMLGRMTSETNPETKNLSYAYVYDTDTTCGTYNGDLVKRTDAVGNVTCYAYDKMHRVTSVTHPSGGYSSSTPARCFVYDSATVNSTSMVNAKGRLAEAYTVSGTSCTGTKLSDLGFSYTGRGEVTDTYEYTFHGGVYNHVSGTRWANGGLRVLSTSPAISGLPTINYGASDGSGLDGEGRVMKVTAGSGQNPVTGVTYNNTSTPVGTLGQLTYGSSDSDAFQYDVNTGRLTQYKFNVGTSNSVTGNLGWSSNGTLATLGITDTLNSANTQSCTFSYDDLARLGTANCGSTKWDQSFVYDPYGNITKNVTGTGISFQSTYSETTNATNQLTLIGTLAPSYDNNGNLTNDTVHAYSWDAEGKMLTVDTNSVVLTYDALGRMIEQNRGGVYTQMLYAPTGGKLALMNGSTLVKAFVPLPAGATAVYAPGTTGPIYYRHSDWLGSSRLATTQSRTMYSDGAYAPFGENYADSGTSDLNFTGQNQDTMQNYYDFMFREYSQVQGRWMSPDPAGITVPTSVNPQSWNRYSYVLNHPTLLVDPLGLRQKGNCGRQRYGPAPYCKDGSGGGSGGDQYGVGASDFDGDPFSPPADWLGTLEGWWLACSGPNLYPSGCGGDSSTSYTPDTGAGGGGGGGGAGGGAAGKTGVSNVGSPQNLIERANNAFDQCVTDNGYSAVGQGAAETVFDASKNKEAPSTADIVVNVMNASLDVQKDCLRDNPLADLSPNYHGLFTYGNRGVDFILGPLFGW